MDVLFSFLFVATAAGLIWGLISPRSLAKHSRLKLARKQIGLVFGSLAIVFLVLVGATTPKQSTNLSAVSSSNSSQSSSKQPIQQTAKPVATITTKTTTQTKSVPFTSTTVQSASLAQGTTKITTRGVNGVETLTYQNTYSNGKQTAQKIISDVVTTQPVTQVTSIGTYVAPVTPTSSCYPLTNGGNCYEPGEYCRTSDYGSSGVAGDGKTITCENNNGWRWEPS